MILIGLGANLPSSHGGPRETLEAALDMLGRDGIVVHARSRWYRSAPVPPSEQPWYVNGVARLETALPPAALMTRLHGIEQHIGRVRNVVNGARAIDLDLLDYDGIVQEAWPVLPHPRLCERAFVLLPLCDVAPDWRDPATARSIAGLLAAIDPAQQTVPLGFSG